MNEQNDPLVVAVDGGGTTCRAALFDRHGTRLGAAHGGASNIVSDFEGALSTVLETVSGAYADAGLSPDRMGRDLGYLGLAGANVADGAERFSQQLPFAKTQVVSDRDAAIAGALGSSDGAVAQIGTGSSFSIRVDGHLRHLGGWGFQLSDECSGAYLGRAVLRATVASYDGLVTPSKLTASVLEKFGGTPAGLVAFTQDATPADYAAFVPDLFAAHKLGDAVAQDIVNAATTRLVEILDILGVQKIGRLCLVGSVGQILEGFLPAPYKAMCVAAEGSALDGAFALAIETWGAAGVFSDKGEG